MTEPWAIDRGVRARRREPRPWGIAVDLRGKRQAAGLTQTQLVDADGFDHTYLSKIERGHTLSGGPSRSRPVT